jgi:hypothetical protein
MSDMRCLYRMSTPMQILLSLGTVLTLLLLGSMDQTYKEGQQASHCRLSKESSSHLEAQSADDGCTEQTLTVFCTALLA